MKSFAIALCLVLQGVSFAQGGAPTPPAESFAPDQPKLRSLISGQQFQWRTEGSERAAPGGTARMNFMSSGVVTTEISTGAFDTGTWKVEGSTLCFQWKTLASGCNDVRVAGEVVWLRHQNGKWSSMTVIRKAKQPAMAG